MNKPEKLCCGITKALYSASVEDRATVCCFFADQDTRFEPKKIEKPPVDLLSTESSAQLALEKAVRVVEPLVNYNP